MKCYRHNTRDAVAQCSQCGKAMCNDCSDRFKPILCENCLVEINSKFKKGLVKKFILSGVLFILGLFGLRVAPFFDSLGFLHHILDAWWMAAIPWGWSFISRIMPEMLVSLRIWIILPLIKLVIAMFIGGIIGIWGLIRDIKHYKEVNQLFDEIHEKGKKVAI